MIRVFARRTSKSPTDENAYYGGPPLWCVAIFCATRERITWKQPNSSNQNEAGSKGTASTSPIEKKSENSPKHCSKPAKSSKSSKTSATNASTSKLQQKCSTNALPKSISSERVRFLKLRIERGTLCFRLRGEKRYLWDSDAEGRGAGIHFGRDCGSIQ